MIVRVAVGQLAPGGDAPENLRLAVALAERAARGGARLLVLPEQTMLAQPLFHPAAFATQVGAFWEEWLAAIAATARRLGLALVAGGFEPSPVPDDPRPLNVLVAVGADGAVLARQAKTRLYDAFAFQESAWVQPGAGGARVPVPLAGLDVGLVNCYELRFPELARELVAAGAGVLAVGAAWARGPGKEDHWNTLTRARAIENCAYVLAAGTRAKDTVGRSAVIDPAGVTRAALGAEPQGIAFAEVDTDLVDATRAVTGSLP
jgi:predicted amidohydrolase